MGDQAPARDVTGSPGSSAHRVRCVASAAAILFVNIGTPDELRQAWPKCELRAGAPCGPHPLDCHLPRRILSSAREVSSAVIRVHRCHAAVGGARRHLGVRRPARSRAGLVVAWCRCPHGLRPGTAHVDRGGGHEPAVIVSLPLGDRY